MVGGAVTLSFTYLFGMRTLRLHVLTVVALTWSSPQSSTPCALEKPFGGIVQVGPEAFDLVLDKVETGGGR